MTISREKPTSRNWYLFELNKCIYIEREMLKIDKKFTSFEINPMNYAQGHLIYTEFKFNN